MSVPSARVAELQVREPTPAQAAEALRAELYLRELREGPPFPMWRILRWSSLRAYAPADQLECYRLELELESLIWRFWRTESFGEVLELRRRMLEIDRGLERRSIGVWMPTARSWRGYLIEGSSE